MNFVSTSAQFILIRILDTDTVRILSFSHQDVIDEAIRKNAAKREESSSSSSASSGDSDADSGFGLGKVQEKGGNKRRRTTAKAKAKAAVAKSNTTASEVEGSATDAASVVSGKAKNTQPKSESRSGSLMEKAQSLLEYLEGISFAAVWTGKTKMKDVELKISKVMEVTGRLDQRVGDASAMNMSERLTGKMEEVHSQTEIMNNVVQQSKGVEFLDLLVSHKDDLKAMLVKFAKDDVMQCLTDLAKKLVEAQLLSSLRDFQQSLGLVNLGFTNVIVTCEE